MKTEVEELLEILKQEEVKRKPFTHEQLEEFQLFLKDVGIRRGTSKYAKGMVYQIYVGWGGKMPYPTFKTLLTRYFRQQKHGKRLYLLLRKGPWLKRKKVKVSETEQNTLD